MATIPNPVINDAVLERLQEVSYNLGAWFGITNLPGGSTWRDVYGNVVEYTNWVQSSGAGSGIITGDGRWYPYIPWSYFTYICEIGPYYIYK